MAISEAWFYPFKARGAKYVAHVAADNIRPLHMFSVHYHHRNAEIPLLCLFKTSIPHQNADLVRMSYVVVSKSALITIGRGFWDGGGTN